jgi:hypothetical protein
MDKHNMKPMVQKRIVKSSFIRISCNFSNFTFDCTKEEAVKKTKSSTESQSIGNKASQEILERSAKTKKQKVMGTNFL